MNQEADIIETFARIARVVNKISHYAEIELIIDTQFQGSDIVFDLHCRPDEYQPAHSWKEGAKEGVIFAMNQCQILFYHVIIKRISGTDVDTNPTIVGGAAIYAIWKAYHFDDIEEKNRIDSIIYTSWRNPINAIPDFNVNSV